MPKDRQEQPGALLSTEEIARNQAQKTALETPPEIPTKPDSQNQGEEKKVEPVNPSKMTVGQYLKRAPQGAGIGELVRSLYKTKIMSFEEWENTANTLLEKQVR